MYSELYRPSYGNGQLSQLLAEPYSLSLLLLGLSAKRVFQIRKPLFLLQSHLQQGRQAPQSLVLSPPAKQDCQTMLQKQLRQHNHLISGY